jgi:PIN domain nuclease of toxin-antitoxin system
MNYLLDTHVLLWLRLSPDELKKAQKTVIESSEEEKFISSISVWEISLKFSLGKLDLGGHTPDEFMAGIHELGIKVITPTPEQYATYYLLPKIDGHRDPFDRMIIWHAMQSGVTLISSDQQLHQYSKHGLKVI